MPQLQLVLPFRASDVEYNLWLADARIAAAIEDCTIVSYADLIEAQHDAIVAKLRRTDADNDSEGVYADHGIAFSDCYDM